MLLTLEGAVDLGTSSGALLGKEFFSPFTKWPSVGPNFIALPGSYSFDLEAARLEIEKIVKDFKLRPFTVGSKHGVQRSRRTYRGLGFTSRPNSEDPEYDALNLYGKEGGRLDIYNTFAKVSEKLPCEERVVEMLDESNFSELTRACTPFIWDQLKKFKSPFSKVRLLELMPGGIIPPHIDFPYYEGIRVHAVIYSNPKVIWEVNGEQFQLPEDGRFYWFDTGKYHSVKNNGDTPRLVLSINLLVYKDREGQKRYGEDDSLPELIRRSLI
jgi:quercetin dioxygenase-like cupin family protein